MSGKLKKALISLGTVATFAAPIALAVSCSPLLGKLGAYDSEGDGIVVIQTTWSAGGAPIAALEAAVKNYNDTQSTSTGYLPVKIEHVEGGYGTVPSQALTKIQSHDTKTLPNLYIDYASAVGMIAPYKMAFDATTSVLKRDLFEDSFVSINDRISGVPKNGLYSIPLARSTEAMIYDRPLLKYIFEKVNAKFTGTVVSDSNNPIIKSIMDSSISSQDNAEISGQWGEIKTDARFDKTGFKITDDIFKDFTSLRDFIVNVQPLFSNKGGGNVLGIDSPSNYMYLISSLLSKNVDKDFLMTKNDSSGFIDFNFLKDGTKQKSTFIKAYSDYIQKPVGKGAMWVGGGGAYGSTRLSKHLMAISLGSSAGLNKSFSKEAQYPNKSEIGFVTPPNHIYSKDNKPASSIFEWEKLTSSISQGPSFNTIHINKQEDEATKRFLEWFFTNKKGQEDSTTNKFAKESQYVVPMKGAFEDTSVIGQLVSATDYEDLPDTVWGLKMGFETIKQQLTNNKNNTNVITSKVFEPPVDDSTGAVRKVIDSKIKASSNSYNSGGGTYSGSSIWNKIHQQAIIDNVIEGEINRTKYIYPNQMNRNFSDIEWNRYQYVDAEVVSWTDGDTPNVRVTSVHPLSDTSAVHAISPGDDLAIRISGIDTPEAHVKFGEIKRKLNVKGSWTAAPLDEELVRKLIDEQRKIDKPLAVYSRGHYNELHYKSEGTPAELNAKYNTTRYGGNNVFGKYSNWKNIYVDIQTPNIDSDANRTIGFDPISKDPAHPNSIYDFRGLELSEGNKLITDLVTTEGFWGLKAGDFGRKEMPAGTKIRVATDGNKSYNRVVGSIFYGDHLEHNWSVEITKTGLTMPFIGDAASVTEPSNIMWENGQAIADAFNSALNAKKGLFDYSSGTLDEHLKWLLATHGATDYSNLLHKSESATIYDYMMYRNPERSN